MSRPLKWSIRGAVLTYLFLLVLLPIARVYIKGFELGWPDFWKTVSAPVAVSAVLVTLKLALFATLINSIIGVMVAFVLTRYRFPGRSLLNSLVDLPFALPTAVGGLMLLLLLGPNSFAGQLFARLGVEIIFNTPAIVIAMVFVTFPFTIRTVQPLLEEIDRSEEEAAFTLGATPWQAFRRVIVPAIKPGIISGAMLTFSRALAEFGAVVMIAGNIPGKTLVASVFIFGEVESYNPEGATAVSIVLLTLSLLILFTVNTLQKRRGNA